MGKKIVARNNSAVSVVRKRLLADMVEMALRAARNLTNDLDEKMCYRAMAPFSC